MKKFILILMILMISPNLVSAEKLSSDSEMRKYYEDKINETDYLIVKAKVEEIEYDDTREKRDIPLEADIRYQHLRVRLLNGKYSGEELTIKHTIERIMPGNYIFKEGDKLLLRVTEEDGIIDTVQIQEKVRDRQVIAIVALFIILLCVFGGLSGIKTLLSLIFTLGMILGVYIPLILKGYPPLLTSIIISIVSIIGTLYIIVGKSSKTTVAIIGTSIGVVCAGILAVAFGKYAGLTGLAEDSAISLAYIPQYRDMNYEGILFGTILIGAIGAIMDVAISIASSLYELKSINNSISKNEMIKSGLNIGKDILGSMSNTLILAYVGSTLHLIILFIVYKIRLIEIINLDSIATEIIRAMAGSIGLLLTIPLTVVIGAHYYCKKEK
ncbi:Uncharacterized membrane protein [Peptoniphilus asaccharolyticus DSM 20463]|uniref:Uncharacterized membrane protein n=1 Tax=Peptoniphilus asaccharolyticus DSM 20463 TaxID=573058 RepID=A0A1W1V9G7_PEPAS|nr:YibE/F family protein [Peptoniphilus asaccharolyticus]MBL7575771.1 YibE/F family protein [Peptoniphilus asaccharolyticus]SMB90049.1 Uncharacterized membrane protein [Peptoniphilus asaccharolyticus DSM 20463]